MRVSIDGLATTELDLELPGPDGAQRLIRISHASGCSGEIARSSDLLTLTGVAIKEGQLTGLEFPLRTGRLSVSTPATLADLKIQTRVDTADGTLTGSFRAGMIDAEALAVLVGSVRVAGDMRCEQMEVGLAPGRGEVSLAVSQLGNVQLSVADMFVRARLARFENLSVSWDKTVVTIRAAVARLLDVEIKTNQAELTLDEVTVEGLAWGDGSATIDTLASTRVAAVVNLSSPAESTETLAVEPSSMDSDASDEHRHIDLRILDGLHGQVNVDVNLDATVPVLGRRRSTHNIRVPVHDGTINYKELERDLSTLEDAFIDIEYRNGNLVLERAVPLIPGMHKPILLWQLTEVERALAKNERIVRLRTLRGVSFPEPRAEKKDSSVAIRTLDFDNVNIRLALRHPADVGVATSDGLPGVLPWAQVAEFTLQGAVHYDAGGAGSATQLELTANDVSCAPRRLTIGRYSMSADDLRVDGIERATLTIQQIQPLSVSMIVHGVAATRLAITFA